MWRVSLACIAATLLLHPARGQDAKPQPSKLQAKLIVRNDTHELEPLKPGEYPWDAKLNVTLAIHNPTEKDIKVIIDPDDGFAAGQGLSLELKGPKVVRHSSQRAIQKFYQEPYTLMIPALKTIEQGLHFIWGGKRQFHYVYWSEPGEYTLQARVVGDGKDYEGFVTEPVKLKVVKSKLQAKLVVKQDTYELEPLKPGEYPWNAKLDIVLAIHNPTAKDIKVIIGPDDGFAAGQGLTLELKGPGVDRVSSERAPQKFLQYPYTLTIPAGKTIEHGVHFVWGGKRQWHYVYWTEPGEYTLRARVVGDNKDYEGFVTEPVKLKVVPKKAK